MNGLITSVPRKTSESVNDRYTILFKNPFMGPGPYDYPQKDYPVENCFGSIEGKLAIYHSNFVTFYMEQVLVST